MPRRSGRVAGLALVASVTGCLVAVGCSLGLDRSRLQDHDASTADGGADASGDSDLESGADGTAQDAVAAETASDVGPGLDAPPGPDAGACATDKDCKAAAASGGACVTSATCDPTWHVCLLDVCGAGACKAEVCDVASSTCSKPAAVDFASASFPVSYGGVIGRGPRYAIAAAWPLLFVATTNGVVAYNVVDPTSAKPPIVGVHGVPFIASAILAVGRRVYMVTDTEGGGPVYRQAVAWIDVPQNPFLTELTASVAWVGVTETPVYNVLTNGVDGLFAIYSSGTLLPTANVRPPLTDTTTLTAFPNAGLAASASLLVSSGSRLLSYRYDGAAEAPNFALIKGAGTSAAQTGAEQALSAYGALANQATFATGQDGSVLWASAPLSDPDAGPVGATSSRLTWLLDSATSTTFSTTAHVDLATYSPPASITVVGPSVWVDANTALGTSPPSSLATGSTLLQAVTKKPAALAPGKSTLLPVGPGAVGLASSNGFAYALEQSDPMNQSCTVQILAPSCTAGD